MRAPRTLWACLAGAVAFALLAGSLGCGTDPGLRDRYAAEKLAWRAAKAVQAMRANPGLATDEMRENVADIYGEIVDRFPPPDDASVLSQAQLDVAAIVARSRMELAEIAVGSEDMDEAVRLYASVRDGYSYNRDLSVEASVALAKITELSGHWEDAVAVYEGLMSDWPPARDEAAIPDARILRAPIRVATGYFAREEEARGREWFERARDYYKEWAEEWPGSRTAELAMSFGAETFLMEERWSDAVVAYEDLDRDYGHDGNRPGIWLTLADTYSNKLNREATARDYYLKVVENYPEEIAYATAALALAEREIAKGEHETARSRLEDVAERFAKDEAVRATAIQYLAISYESEGLWDSAIAQLNALAREHPTTLYGLTALQHIAEHYEERGESGAARVALDKAADHYERVVRDYAATPAELAARGYLIDTRLKQERWEDAARVLVETAERFPDSGSSPDMMLRAADMYENRLADAGAAAEVLRLAVNLFPGTRAAAVAELRLGELTE
ncbi:MAG: tetratricopeptide repeat protein [Candidatus Eisenbacteria bacterium]|nr:tetratricopeptide repeat protein [Candidatus Eisenbacteria bacterium]